MPSQQARSASKKWSHEAKRYFLGDCVRHAKGRSPWFHFNPKKFQTLKNHEPMS